MENFNSIEYSNSEYAKPIIDLSKTTKIARKKIQEITQKDGYWDISKEIYLKHGSRRTSLIKRKNYPKKNNIKPKSDLQYELHLEL
jgi:deoxyribodipyrimidine photo-lyase